eukprot:scaffold1235_cov199-Alexandrium_tamarense.AAC.1
MRNGASYGWNGERRKVVCVCRVACGAAQERGRSVKPSARDGVGSRRWRLVLGLTETQMKQHHRHRHSRTPRRTKKVDRGAGASGLPQTTL